MQYKSFIVPVFGEATAGLEEELNSFLRGHRVLSVHRELLSREGQPVWCFSVEYLEGKGEHGFDRKERPDYRELLPPEEFARFRVLREIRKELAAEDKVPPYAIFLDTDLAELSKLTEVTAADLKAIKGFGEKKFVRFGARFLERLATVGASAPPETAEE